MNLQNNLQNNNFNKSENDLNKNLHNILNMNLQNNNFKKSENDLKNNLHNNIYMNSEKNNISNKYIDMNITNILKNKINKQLNLHVTDKNTIKHFSKYVDSLADDKQSLKTFNLQ